MENIMENPVIEEVTENTEPPVEESPKLYTQADLNKVREEAKKGIGMRLDRQTAKIRKEVEGKYAPLMDVLRAGSGIEDIGEMTEGFRSFYQKQGKNVERPSTPTYSEDDLTVLAAADADEIIGYGMEDVEEELHRLTEKGADKMTPREKAVFKKLEAHRQEEKRRAELAKIGISEEVYKSDDFQNFAAKFQKDVPITEVYAMYAKNNKTTDPIETIGSMKNGGAPEEKHYYTPEEVDRLTPADYENPQVVRDVRESMLQWK